MLSYFYQTVLPLTFAGSLAMLLVLAVTPLARRRLGSRWHYYARLVPTLLFLLPVPRFLPAPPHTAQPVQAVLKPIESARELLAVTEPVRFSHPSYWQASLPALLWLLGMAALLLYSLWGHLRFQAARRRLSTHAGDKAETILAECQGSAAPRRVRLARCRVGSPMLVGIFRPCILLPEADIPPEELRMILTHELIHLRRGDLFFKLAVLAVRLTHWFNPLVWLLSAQVNEWCELSCDERLVRAMDPGQRKAYGFAILNQLSRAQNGMPPVSSGFSQKQQQIVRRLNFIMDGKKQKKIWMIAGAVLAVTLCTVSVAAASSFQLLEESAGARLAAGPAQTLRSAASKADGLAAMAGEPAEAGEPEQEQLEPAEPTIAENASLKAMDWGWPVGGDGGWVSMNVGDFYGHAGMDIAPGSGKNTEVLAAASGTVAYARTGYIGYGNYIVLDHGDGITTLYAHCEKLLVEQGDEVALGDQIAVMGRSGNATGTHMHFEMRLGGAYIDPAYYIDQP